MEHPEASDHDELADEFDRRADEMAHENAKLSDEIDAVRQDWEAKRADSSVPGAVPRPEGDSAGDAHSDDPPSEDD